MSSLRRILASRANGARSCGPVTEAGKQASARNSLRHGLLAQTVVLDGESVERFQELLDAFQAEFQPQSESEHVLIERLATARWRQLRAWAIQNDAFNREMSRHDGPPVLRAALAFRRLSDHSRTLHLALRYETTFDRQFARALKAIENVRARRASSRASNSTFENGPGEKLFLQNEPSPNIGHSPIKSPAPLTMKAGSI